MKILTWITLFFALYTNLAMADEQVIERKTVLTPVEYQRGEDNTYLTTAEWFLVFSPEEYARYLQKERPSDFPFLGHIQQFWQTYWASYQAVKDRYPFNTSYHVMVMVIGTSTTVEYLIKGLYESFIGGLTESNKEPYRVSEDAYSAQVAQDYVDFIYKEPWYRFDFISRARGVWTENSFWDSSNPVRKFERKYALTSEYLVKALYGKVIAFATGVGFDPAIPTTALVVHNTQLLSFDGENVKKIRDLNSNQTLMTLPRYGEFTLYATEIANKGVDFDEIAGNSGNIVVSIIAPINFKTSTYPFNPLLVQSILTDPNFKRVVYEVKITQLAAMLRDLSKRKIRIEHLYDY